jgi:hypothetical protein
MKIAHIAPTKVLPLLNYNDDDFHLCLVDRVLADREYAKFYYNRPERSFLIMDVPAFEERGSVTRIDDIRNALSLVQPDEIVLPDKIEGTGPENVELARIAAHELEFWDIPFMAVPHGTNRDEYFRCAFDMTRIPGVRTLGVYEETLESIKTSRIEVFTVLKQSFPNIAIHLLGCLEDLVDIQMTSVREQARSMDTCKFIRWARDLDFVTLEYIPTYPGRGADFFDLSFSSEQVNTANANMEYWNTFCSSEVDSV